MRFLPIALLLGACAAAPAPAPAPSPPARFALLAGLPPCPPPTPTPRPSPSAPGFGFEGGVIVAGVVLDPAGEPAEGALVVARSLEASVPYTATATTLAGSWVVNNLPAGARMAVSATGPGWRTAPVILVAEPGRGLRMRMRAEAPLAPLGPEVAPPTPTPAASRR